MRKWLFFLIVCLGMVCVQGCPESSISVNEFECDNSSECKQDKVCEEGKCVKKDNDKDSWAPGGKGRDCDDNNPNVYPGAPEICENKIDENCNGVIDEQPCRCVPGTEKECGPTATGICKPGKARCNKRGQWGDCVGEITAQKEDCNGLDDDCNGQVDENISGSCYGGPAGTANRGSCIEGKRNCNAGKWSKCVGEVVPKKEDCNAADDDCDGLIDNGLEKPCYKGPNGTEGRGACKAGRIVCTAGKWSECTGEVLPKPEDCNNQDDDCDGKVDEELDGDCYNGPASSKGVGQCRAGKRSCNGGAWTQCIGEITPAAKETCGDNKDNNCDGSVDEGCGPGLYEVKQSINTDNGKIDGILSPGWKGQGRFELPNLRIPANVRVTVKGKNLLTLTVRGPVELLGTLDLSGQDGGSTNCSTSNSGQGGAAGGGGGGKGGDGGSCNTSGSQPPAGDGLGNGAGKGGKGGGANAGGGGGAGHASPGKSGLPSGFGGKGGLPVGTATTVTPGSGGGGGACGVYGSSIFGIYTPGAAGGGGGGGVQIESTVSNILIAGNIIANGGDGGAAPACGGGITPGKATGGGGGGGGGGTILLRAKGEVQIKPSAFLNAKGGSGNGTTATKGGDGSDGRIRFQDADGKVTYPVARVTPTPTQAKY